MRKIAILLLVPCLAQAEELSLERLQKALQAIIETEQKEPCHVISDIKVYDYYSRTVGKKNKK